MQARSNHEASSRRRSSSSPNSKALSHGAQARRWDSATAGALAKTAAGGKGLGTIASGSGCRLAAASAS